MTPKRRRWLWVLVFAAACGAALLIFVSMTLLRARFHPENIARLQVGMTQAEVEELLGGPPGDYGVWRTFGTHTMSMDVSTIVPAGSREAVWCDDDHFIRVYFDANDRFVHVYKRPKWERRFW